MERYNFSIYISAMGEMPERSRSATGEALVKDIGQFQE